MINKPSTRKYWFAYSEDAVHYGVTEPNQVTESGLSNFDVADDEDSFLTLAANHDLPELPAGALRRGELYKYRGDSIMVKEDHVRGAGDPVVGPKFKR